MIKDRSKENKEAWATMIQVFSRHTNKWHSEGKFLEECRDAFLVALHDREELEKEQILTLLKEWKDKGFEIQNAIEHIEANVHRSPLSDH